ncbi:MAG: helicase-associated domain-containing protein [Gemmatales bacterium]|nr:helicase-associated domain-containing protein [Gemmatales bacterium]MDW8385798.1 helicase-associated domain-containing protein [Gemmatales bacterium]
MTDSSGFSSAFSAALSRYAPSLRKRVADNLLRDRSKLTPKQTIERMAAAVQNVPLIDRRLRELKPEARGLLTLMHQGLRFRWTLAHALELACVVGSENGLDLILSLCENGLLFAELPDEKFVIEQFEQWVPKALSERTAGLLVPPRIAERAAGSAAPLGLEASDEPQGNVEVYPPSDGLEMPLRLAVLWQKMRFSPPRLKHWGGIFKKDREQLQSDPLLNAPGPTDPVEIPNAWGWHFVCGLAVGLIWLNDDTLPTQVFSGQRPDLLLHDLPTVLKSLWACNDRLESWLANEENNPAEIAMPWPATAGIAVVAALGQLPPGQWCSVNDLAFWLVRRHPRWKSDGTDEAEEELAPRLPRSLMDWLELFLLGWAYRLGLVEAARDSDKAWFVRLSNVGRGILGLGPMPSLPHYPRTLLVQPNLEIIAYRQGLTPELIGNLSRFCEWKSLGPACTLQLTPESVYRGLETGLTHEDILRLLQQHAVRELPDAVTQALRTWANKRERITVYAAATLLEFPSADALQAALSRGLPALVLNDRLALVEREDDLDYRQFRLMATRDYGLPPDRCVQVSDDGVTLSVDVSRSDLLLETELQRFAEPVSPSDAPFLQGQQFGKESNRRAYRMTPASLRRAREDGLNVEMLDDWFRRRTGSEAPPAVRLFLNGTAGGSLHITTLLVLQAPSAQVADGLMQWPESRRFIRERLGPTALSVEQADLPALLDLLRSVGITVQ